VNGPVARQIGVNSKDGCLGPDPTHPAGGSIGRAVRLLFQNVGGGLPGTGSMAGFGGPARYTSIVFAEDEDGMPADWAPLNVERGFPKSSNVVTAFAVSGTTNVNGSAAETEDAAIMTLRSLAGYLKSPNRNYFGSGYNRPAGVVLMGAVTARGFSKLGWSKQRIREFLWENSKRPMADWTFEGCGWSEEKLITPKEYWQDPMPITFKPEKILLVVAGGDKSRHSYWMQAGLGPEDAVSVEVKLPADWDRLVGEATDKGV
ncbi:MAG: hypothetical protein HYX90_09295, partial [Chloroflexi bacterium]|nr:hypothetical protein [Chloroflexota bacterium]